MVKSLLLLTLLATLLGAFCAKKSKVCRDQVLLQVSNSASSLMSATALRLRRRLAADPTVVDRAAAALGVELKPMQRKLVDQLKAAGASNHTEHLSLLQRAEEDGAALMDQMATLIDGELGKGDVKAARADLFNAVVNTTSNFFAQWVSTGKVPGANSILTDQGGLMGTMIGSGMNNPIAGAAFTLFASAMGGFSGAAQSDIMAELYEKIMKDVKNLVANKVNEAQANEFRTEASMIIKEMHFAFSLFQDENNHQAAAGFEDQLNLVWLTVFQHDLRRLRHLFVGVACYPYSNPPNDDCYNWHKQCTFLQVFEVINAERAAALDAMVLEPRWGMEREKRIIAEIPDVVDIVSQGQWACLGELQRASLEAAAVDAQEMYQAAWQKFPAFLNLSTKPHHKAYVEYARRFSRDSSSEPKMIDVGINGDFMCLDKPDTKEKYPPPAVCGEPRGLLQGVGIPNWHYGFDIGGRISRIEHLAYNYFDIDESKAYQTYQAEGCQSGDFVTRVVAYYGEISEAHRMKCNRPKEHPSGWGLGECSYDSTRDRRWKGCPAGMFITWLKPSVPYEEYHLKFEMSCCALLAPQEIALPQVQQPLLSVPEVPAQQAQP